MRITLLLAAVVVCGLLTPRLAAQDEGKSKSWFETVTVNGFVSTGFTYNLNKPDTGRNMFRVFDGAHNTFTLDVFELSFKRDAAERGDAGFRLDLAGGASIPPLTRSAGFTGGDIDVQQMYVTWMAPLGNGLKIDVGKFVTPLGWEVIEGHDGWNDNYSRSFLFGYAIPFTHTGLRAGYAFSPSFSLACFVVNGWDLAVDNNASKSLGAQVFLSPVDGLSVYANAISGPEQSGNNSDTRSVFDFSAAYSISGSLTIAANADFGSEAVPNSSESVAWSGFAGYLRYMPCEMFAVSLRGEMFDDTDGSRTGVAQKLTGITVTPEYRPAKGLVIRMDLRMDTSDKTVFQKAGEYTDSQTTIGLNLLYVY